MRPQHGPWRRCCCTPTLTYGPTFPFVQFKPPEAGERIRAVLSGAGCRPGSGSQHVSCKETNHERRKQVVRCIVNSTCSRCRLVADGGLMSYGGRCARPISAVGGLCRSHPKGCQAWRASRASADQIRAGNQPQDRQSAWPDGAVEPPAARRELCAKVGDGMKG